MSVNDLPGSAQIEFLISCNGIKDDNRKNGMRSELWMLVCKDEVVKINKRKATRIGISVFSFVLALLFLNFPVFSVKANAESLSVQQITKLSYFYGGKNTKNTKTCAHVNAK